MQGVVTLVLIANNKRWKTLNYDNFPGAHVVRFNHCLSETRHLMNGRVDELLLRSHNYTDLPWGVDKRGKLMCRLASSSTSIIKVNPSRFDCSSYSKCTTLSTASCKFRRGDCSSGFFALWHLEKQYERVVLIGFSSHFEDKFNVRYHDFPSEKAAIDAMMRTKNVSVIPC